MTSKTDPLIEFLRGRLSWRNLPEEIDLPHSLWQQMDELWQRSIAYVAEGQVSEWGGVLVLDEQDHLRIIGETKGTAGQVTLDPTVSEGETFVGTFHTHPYASGLTGIAFSGADFASTINHGQMLSVVQSGDDVFALMRTDQTPRAVDNRQLAGEFNEAYREYYRSGLSAQDAALLANLVFCTRYGLVFYSGKNGQSLKEVYKP